MYFNLKEPNSSKGTLIILRYFISKKEGQTYKYSFEALDPPSGNLLVPYTET